MTFDPYHMLPPSFLTKFKGEMMKNYILSLLVAGNLIVINQQVHAMDNSMPMQGQSDMMMNMQKMMEVTEEDLLSNFNEQDKALYKQLNAQQKALVLKAANQSCKARMQKMHQMMMQRMHQQENK